MKDFLRFFLILGIGFLCTGTVLKRKGAVELTQTDPVGYQDKLKEEEEGKKGPPSPKIELFPKERFLTEGPVEEGKKDAEEEELFKPESETDDTSDTDEEMWEFDETEWEELQGEEEPERPRDPLP